MKNKNPSSREKSRTRRFIGKFCCCCSVTKPCLTLCDPTDCSTPGLPVPRSLPEFAQVHVNRVTLVNHLILWPLLLLLPSVFPSIVGKYHQTFKEE